MEKISLWKRLKKHYLLIVIGFLTFLLLMFLCVYRVMHPHQSTPIASISPLDSVSTLTLPGKLESYKKELIEQEKAAYQRKIALDEIVAMDFSQEMKTSPARQINSSRKSDTNRKLPEEKEDNEPATADFKTQHPSTAVKLSRKMRKPATGETEAKKAGDGFYTIKPANSNPESKEAIAGQPFIKAVIHGNQKIKGAGIVCLRLIENANIGEYAYPKNTILYGRISSSTGGRMRITVSQLQASKVHLSVYDQDYIEGIAYQTRETVSEIARESRKDVLNEVFSSLPYGGVAGGLAQLGRNIGRKTKRTNPIYLADGYPVFMVVQSTHTFQSSN